MRTIALPLLLCLVAACTTDDSGHTADTSPTADTLTDTADVAPPAITGVTITENPNSRLSAFVSFSTDQPATVAVHVEGVERSWRVSGPDVEATTHELLIIGLRADSTYTLTAEAVYGAGPTATAAAEIYTTRALPEDFPPITVTGQASQPLLFSLFRWIPGIDPNYSLLMMVDTEGHPIWYTRVPDGRAGDAHLVGGDRVRFTKGDTYIGEVNLAGALVFEARAEDLATDSLHHESADMPNGHILTLSSALHKGVEYPDGNGTVSYDIVSDIILEFDPATMTVVKAYDLFDILDPQRRRPGFDGGFWNAHYADETDVTKDWSHGNAVTYDPSDDTYVVSARHLDLIAKIARADGRLVWTLGDGGTVALGDGEWPYHAHGVSITAAGTLLIFDNGNGRPGADPPYSRGVEIAVEASDATDGGWIATQRWEWRADPDLFAPFLGDVDVMDAGTLLVSAGGTVSDPTLAQHDPDNQKQVHFFEVAWEADATPTFALHIVDDNATRGHSAYRADPVPASLFGQ